MATKTPPTLLKRASCDSGKRLMDVGMAGSQSTPKGVATRSKNLSLPLVGQRRNLSAGTGVGVASAWGCVGVRGWKSACEDTGEEMMAALAEDTLSTGGNSMIEKKHKLREFPLCTRCNGRECGRDGGGGVWGGAGR